MTDTPTQTTTYVQMDYLIMELIQKNFYLHHASEMFEQTPSGIFKNDLASFIQKVEAERQVIRRKISDAC